MSRFFVSCAIGFETELFDEMNSFWFEMMDLDGQPTRSTLENYEILVGGIEMEVADHLGFQINLFSKIANRVLLRIHKFEARYFDQFEKEFKKIDFDKYIEPQNIILKVEAHKSRINNQKSIEESVTQLLKAKKMKVIETSLASDAHEQLLYIRIDKDRVTVSLDTSSQHLHRRGYAINRGEAPLRETFAAFIVKQVFKIAEMKDLSIVDPFVGSGTILFEAQSAKLPHLLRPYKWIDFKNRPKIFKSDSWQKNYKWIKPSNKIKCIGIDSDKKAISSLKENEKIFNTIFSSHQSEIDSICLDSLKFDLSKFAQMNNLWLLTNPPYGHRLAEGEAVKIIEKFETELNLKGIAVLHPESWNFKFKKLKLASKIDFNNQGLKLKLSVYN